MSAKLTAGVLVRHPDSGTVEFLPEGSELPDWADGLVGDHALDRTGDEPKSERPPPGRSK